METWTWEKKLSVGINLIDNQHKEIITFINELNDAAKKGERQQISNVLDGLLDYTTSHFAFEEDLMAKAGYPMTEGHKKIHGDFIQRIENFATAHHNGKDISTNLLTELQMWLINHIQQEDVSYSPFAKRYLQNNSPKKGLRRFFDKRH